MTPLNITIFSSFTYNDIAPIKEIEISKLARFVKHIFFVP